MRITNGLWAGLVAVCLWAPSAASSDRLPGIALPRRQVALHASSEGRLMKVHVREGQRVEAGAALAELDRSIQEAIVAAAVLRAGGRSALRRAEKELAEAAIVLAQITRAHERDAARDWEVRRAALRRDLAQVAVEAAREAIAVAEAELELERRRLARLTLTAPWEGLVTRVAADPGATVGPNDPILVLINLEALEAEVHLSVDLYPRMKVGQTYKLSAGEPIGRVVEGRLIYASKMIDPASRTFRCVFEIDNADRAMPAGFPVQLVEPGAAAP